VVFILECRFFDVHRTTLVRLTYCIMENWILSKGNE
jgi:hypothetical protein